LAGSNFSAHEALIKPKQLRIPVQDDRKIVKEFTADQRKIFTILGYECPFQVESGNQLKKKSFMPDLSSQPRKRGRPKGSKNKVAEEPQVIDEDTTQQSSTATSNPESVRHRGRPKGSKNRERVVPPVDSTASTQQASPVSPDPEVKRPRGRPKGSKNKVKSDQLAEPTATAQLSSTDNPNPEVKRPRGRPKGAKNKVKSVPLA
jgi:hypothetical protein